MFPHLSSHFHTALQSLGLADCNIGDDGAQYLSESLQNNNTLSRLVLSGNCIGDEGVNHLAGALSQNNTLAGLFLAEVRKTTHGNIFT